MAEERVEGRLFLFARPGTSADGGARLADHTVGLARAALANVPPPHRIRTLLAKPTYYPPRSMPAISGPNQSPHETKTTRRRRGVGSRPDRPPPSHRY